MSKDARTLLEEIAVDILSARHTGKSIEEIERETRELPDDDLFFLIEEV